MNTDETSRRERQHRAYRRWYRKNKSALSGKAAIRYRTDPEYRKKALARSRLSRLRWWHTPEPSAITVDGKRVYRMSEAARMIGCNPGSFRRWHGDGWIPEPHKENGRRLYTLAQVKLIAKFYAPYQDRDRRNEISSMIHACW